MNSEPSRGSSAPEQGQSLPRQGLTADDQGACAARRPLGPQESLEHLEVRGCDFDEAEVVVALEHINEHFDPALFGQEHHRLSDQQRTCPASHRP